MNISKVSFQKLPRFLRDSDVVASHQFVMSLFPDAVGETPRSTLNILWRREVNRQGETHFLIQSDQTPSIEYVKSSLRDTLTIESRSVEELYSSLVEHDSFSYKVRVNPVVAQGHKRFAVKGEENIVSWWEQRLNRMGARTVDGALSVDIEPLGRGVRASQPLVISSATIVGRMHADDPQRILSTVRNGIGKSRSYGYGLILLGS